MTTIPSIESTPSFSAAPVAAGMPPTPVSTGLPTTPDTEGGPLPGGTRSCASALLADNATLQTVLKAIVAAPLSPTTSPERSVELVAPSALAVPSAPSMEIETPVPPTLVGGDVLGAPRPDADVPPAESSPVVSSVVSARPDAAVVDGSSDAARRGRRALPSEGAVREGTVREGTVQGTVPSVAAPSTTLAALPASPTLLVPPAPPTLAIPSAPSTVIETPVPPTLVGGDVLGAPRPDADVPPAESSPVVSSVVSARPDAAVVDGSSDAARRGRRALPSEGAVPGSAPPTLAVPPAPLPTLVGGDVLGAPRPDVGVSPAESSSVVSPVVPPVVSAHPDAAVVDGSSDAARRGRRALPSEGGVQKAASPAPSAPSAPTALPVSVVVPEVFTPAPEADPAPVTAVEAVVAAFAPSVARAVEPAQVFVEAARAVADTLLVTPGLLRGEGEIRIQLRPDVLDGTEIHIAVAGRQLTVAFTPPTPELAALIEQSRPQLTAHLAERIHSFQIAVDVRRRVRSEERG